MVEGDLTGLAGVQLAGNAQLAGEPGMRIEAVSTDAAAAVTTLEDYPGRPGADVTVTLDSAVQLAADATLAVSGQPVALWPAGSVPVGTWPVPTVQPDWPASNRLFQTSSPPAPPSKLVPPSPSS